MERLWRLYCHRLRLGIATSKIRQFFIYASILTMGSPVIIYLVLAFWRNIRRYIWAQKEIPGIIYKNKGRKFLQPLSHKKQKCLSDRTEKDCSILSF
jgi:hypothetical protein